MIAAEVQNTKASWLSDIPSHWNVVRLKTIVKGGTNGVWGSEPKNNKNDIVCVRVADIDEWQYGISQSDLTRRNISDTDQSGRLLNFGDLIIEKSGGGEISPVGRVVIFNLNEKAVTSNFMARLNVVGDINKEFLYYYFRFLYHRRLNHPAIKATTGIQNLDLYAYLQNPIPIPTPKEQTEIVSFINHTSGEITHFIQTKQRFIELLKEQRQSIITNAVTKGIDENVKMKETGIDWIPNIPENWSARRLRFLVKITTGKKNTEDRIADGEYPFYVRSQTIERINSYSFEGEGILTAGDGVGVGKVFHYVNGKFDFHQRVYLFYDIDKEIEGEFLFNYLQANMMSELMRYNSKSTVDSIRLPVIKNFLIVFPERQEQKRILEHIKSETKTLDIAISKAEREIELIKEYREAMIAEAVTGKMKL
jgi:type I restriction enzyme S subunit